MRFALVLPLMACGLQSATAPGGLLCDRINLTSGDLAADLAAAKPNDCVILTTGTYTGAFELPVDVSLAGATSSTVLLKGDGSGKPVLTIRGGRRSTVRGVKIDSSAGNGVAIDPGPANLVGVVVAGNTSHDALTSTCTRGACEEIVLEDCELGSSTVGLLVSGGRVRMVRGKISGMGGSGLSDGSGVVASNGADVKLEQVTVENNAQVGVLVDGAATRVTLDQAAVRGNLERGVWIQSSDGGVSITGGAITGNRLVGVGIRESEAVRLTGVEISGTQLVEVPTGISQKENVGDGVGLFTGARDVVLDMVRASSNGRAQILADACGPGIRVTAPEVFGGQFRIVVQRGAATVDAPAALVDDPGRVLATKSEKVPVARQ